MTSQIQEFIDLEEHRKAIWSRLLDSFFLFIFYIEVYCQAKVKMNLKKINQHLKN